MARTAKHSAIAGRRRGRPTLDRVAAIDAAIQEAALGIFLDLGYEAASMDAIALQAGVSKGTLYARYENKELLFRAVLEEELKRWSRRAGSQDHLLPRELVPRLRHHARTLVEVFGWLEYRRLARLIDGAAAALPNVALHWEEMGAKRYLRFLAEDMARVAGDKQADWDFHAKLFLFSISGWYRAEAVERTVQDEEVLEFADRVIDMIQTGIDRSGGPPE